MAKVRITNNTDKVLTVLKGNINAALHAMGVKAVNLILHQMRRGYGRPIRKTGDLQRDVTYEVGNSGENTVDVGNTLHQFKKAQCCNRHDSATVPFSCCSVFCFPPCA